ncbi:LysM domain-containing protein [Proteinivorax hydrogeniformans]|uniref:LysM domain-containing protein n=1 Tax=Proteinivorax hydrogeniformans TaxID=1826727 RepID=A0AAU8HRL5_9FIRM
MYHYRPRKPKFCPANFSGRYTVVPGDTMFFISKRFNVNLDDLIDANPHISNPHKIYPGDVLCVPKKKLPPPKKECPCPITLTDFINFRVEVTTTCEVVTGRLVDVGDHSITLVEPKTSRKILVRCKEICFVRVISKHKRDGEDEDYDEEL